MNWRVGQRVCREEDPEQLGTVTEVDRQEIKVKWDSGVTSYYRPNGDYVPLKDATSPPSP